MLPLAGIRVLEFCSCHHGAERGAHSRRSRRRRDQGRADRRRYHAAAVRFRRRFLRHVQPQQAQPRRRSQNGRRPRVAASARHHRRCCDRELRARHHGPARLRLCGFRQGQSAPDLLRAQRLSQRPLRAPPSARRGGAIHGRARLHDRAAGPAATRRLVRRRHHGRRVRGHCHPGGSARARAHRARPAGQIRAVRNRRRFWSHSTWPARRSPDGRRRRCRRAKAPGRSTIHS